MLYLKSIYHLKRHINWLTLQFLQFCQLGSQPNGLYGTQNKLVITSTGKKFCACMMTVYGITFCMIWFTFSPTFILQNCHAKNLPFYFLIYRLFINSCCSHDKIYLKILVALCLEPSEYKMVVYGTPLLCTYVWMWTLLVPKRSNGFKNYPPSASAKWTFWLSDKHQKTKLQFSKKKKMGNIFIKFW